MAVERIVGKTSSSEVVMSFLRCYVRPLVESGRIRRRVGNVIDQSSQRHPAQGHTQDPEEKVMLSLVSP